ncbi:uncharacterized mitochondrial protein AtMg00310-like [Cannabis sativa]|uniref:uncharacterized mitochondrial protein AtMg00310-like n=1 Tax=Cannabis sativa TaxID=3483 RepID=UPI0029CAA702|nr:uncharacterized mitochondrial protein AtMg00310-like [Cannabis sativa]
MSVFLIPLETCSELEKLMSKYWWGNSKKSRGISWMSWNHLSKHKSSGGIDFRNLHDYNLSFLGKQAWRLLTNETSLIGRIYKSMYYPQGTFLSAVIGNNPSFIWRSIFEAQPIIAVGAPIRIGAGLSVPVLNSPWLSDTTNPCVISSHLGLVGVMLISS